MELSNSEGLAFPEESIQVEYTKNYLLGFPRQSKRPLREASSNEVTRYVLGGGSTKDGLI